ncbi:MAG TPA: HD domain-containing protein [Bryocella sp.]|nr:HD domain-containing protein [Bryocella sp.]
MKDFFVADAARFENQAVTSFFCLASISLRERKGGGGQYLALTLSDRTGQFEARMWEEFANVVETCAEGCYVKVQGQISKYNGRFQITLTRMRAAAEGEIESGDFVPTTQYEIPAMMAELREYVEAFTNPHLRALVLRFFDDPAIGAAFQEAPAAKRLHHAWLGGLLEHVLALVRVCRATAPFYPEVDPDLLVTGAILHDIGKVRELSWRSNFNYTLEGQLVGHITIAQRMLAEAISGMDAEARERAQVTGEPAVVFPEPLRVLVEHMILAHHGKLEFGSPKLPMTPEAMLLSALDDLEAKFQTMRAEFAAARDAGRRPDEPTEWVRSMARNLFDSRRFLEAQTTPVVQSETKHEEPPAPAGISEESPALEPIELIDLFSKP